MLSKNFIGWLCLLNSIAILDIIFNEEYLSWTLLLAMSSIFYVVYKNQQIRRFII